MRFLKIDRGRRCPACGGEISLIRRNGAIYCNRICADRGKLLDEVKAQRAAKREQKKIERDARRNRLRAAGFALVGA